ncbi:reverse transcriptase domain-containing protein [Streptomyces lacrimifluminis]|nr:reverse transcriptase domain-containing protein [Streptomyces lacrimifluminis]
MDSKRSVIKWVEANFCGGTRIPKEIMTMPKNKFGQRPIILTSLTSRIIYQALVSSVADSMEPNSRGGEGWVQHETFAEESPSEFIVEVDIAACYEFIDHERLRQELVARTLNVEVARSITDFLGECSPNKRGLPQLTSASDTLGDLYLSVIQRQLMRQGLEVSRYADDFLIRAKNWEQANETIEYAAEFARDLGLILSYEKTRAVRSSTFKKKAESQRQLQRQYFDSERERMTFFHLVGGDRYGDVSLVELLPSDAETLKASMRRVITHWQGETREAEANPDIEFTLESSLRRMLPLAISVLQEDSKRIPTKVFTSLAFREPVRLERVCQYVLARAHRAEERSESWGLVKSLTDSGRLSPWARLWILHVVSELPEADTSAFREVMRWVTRQLSDRHETVRAQAAWAAAKFRNLNENQVLELLRYATPVTQPGIAAAMGRKAGVLAAAQRGGGLSNTLIKSVTSENTLLKESYEWGERI